MRLKRGLNILLGIGLYLSALEISLSHPGEKDPSLPNFVVNVIVRVPSSFHPMQDIDAYKEQVNALPYYIEKDINAEIPHRGKLWQPENIPPSNERAKRASEVLGPFLDKMSREGFSDNDGSSLQIAPERLRVAALFNRMRSVCEGFNQEFYNMADDLSPSLQHKIIRSLWEPQWKKRYQTETGQTKHEDVNIGEVIRYYNELNSSDPTLAQAFLQINEHDQLNSIVPYRELRDTLLHDEATKSLVRASRASNPKAPVYIEFMDADVVSFRTTQQGVFSFYSDAIAKSMVPFHVVTTGYTISANQDPFAALASAFDLEVRQALASVFPLAPYYPDPNTAFRVLDDEDTLEFHFPGVETKYKSPLEIPKLIEELVKARFKGSKTTASPHFKFLSHGAIETECPGRFLQNRRKKDGTCNAKRFSGRYIPETQHFSALTSQDLTHVRNTSQSHLKTLDWAGYVYGVLKEDTSNGSIQIVDVEQPGSTVKTQKKQVIKSLFGSLRSAYSPVAITLRDVQDSACDLMERLFSFVRDYAHETPSPLRITFGKDTKAKNTKPTGDLLRKHVFTYGALGGVIDKFYTRSVAPLVVRASQLCGEAEVRVIRRFFQTVASVADPRNMLTMHLPETSSALSLERIPAQAKVKIEELPSEPTKHTVEVVYPEASLTLQNVQTLLKRLNEKVTYALIDTFVGYGRNSDRIAREAKQISAKVRTLWDTFKQRSWDDILERLKISIEGLATILKVDPNDVKRAAQNSRFLNVFFGLMK